jgi:hypothetical protein
MVDVVHGFLVAALLVLLVGQGQKGIINCTKTGCAT